MPLHVLVAGVDASPFYRAGSMAITERTGSDRSSFTFTLENPTVPVAEEMEVIVWDSDLLRRKEAAGRVKRVQARELGMDDTGAARFAYDVEVGGYIRDVQRQPLQSQVYTTKTTGFIVRDLATFLPGFSAASVSTGGRVLPVFEARQTNIARTLDRLAQAEGFQWWVDLDKELRFQDPALAPAPFAMDDASYRDIAGLTLRIEPDTDNLANDLKMFYRSKYEAGMVNVFNGLNEITAPNLDTAWTQHVVPGASFRIKNAQLNGAGLPIVATYTVESVVDDFTIRLASDYAEITQSSTIPFLNGPVEYIIDNVPRATRARDVASQALLALVTGDNGVFADIVADPGGSLTFAEAQQYLTDILKQRANPAINITFKSTSHQIPGAVTAGMSVVFALSEWGVASTFQIRQLSKRDLKGVLADGHPLWEYGVTIETRLYDLAARLRRGEDQALDAQTLDSVLIDDVLGAYEPIHIGEVNGILEATGTPEGVVISSSSEVGPEYQGPYQWAPSANAALWGRSEWS